MDAPTPDPRAPEPAGLARGRRNELGRAALWLGALLLAAYANVVFTGRSLVYSNAHNPLQPPVSEAAYGPQAERIGHNLLRYANFHDPGGAWWQWEPGARYLRDALRAGEPPFWDPWSGAGAPAMANLLSTFFYPPYLLVVLAGDTPLLRTLYALATLFASGLVTFLWLRRHRLGFAAAAFGGAVWISSGAMAQNVGSFIGQATAAIPAALWLTRWFLDRPSWRRGAALASGYAAISLASFPPVLLALFGFTAFYAVGMALAAGASAGWRERFGVLARWAVAAALGLGLVAFYYLPFVSLARSTPHVAAAYGEAGAESLPAVCLLQLASPAVAGGGKVYLDPPFPDPFRYQLPYLGLMPLLLALAASRRGAGGSRVFLRLVLGAAALVALLLFGVAPMSLLARLPGLEHVHFAAYFGLLLDFLLAVLAAMGLETLLGGGLGRRRATLAAAALALLVVNLLQAAAVRGVFDHPKSGYWWRDFGVLAAVGAATAALLAIAARRGTGRRLVALLLAVFAVEALYDTAYPRAERWDVWRHPAPYVETLVAEAGTGRVFNAEAFPANAGSAFEIFGLDSLHPFNSTRVFRLYKRYAAPQAAFFLREAERLPKEGVLDRANVELLALGRHRGWLIAEAEARGYAVVYADDFAKVFRRPSSPRYFFSSDYRLTTGLEALRGLGKLAPGRHLVLERRPSFASAPNRPDDPPVAIAAFGRNRYRLTLDAPRPGLVYCSESSMPGWTARVNGRPAEILAANFAFRAVEVPAGEVTLEMGYRPPGLVPGLAVSGAALLAVLCLPWVGSGSQLRGRRR
jgi:hypothetical protein